MTVNELITKAWQHTTLIDANGIPSSEEAEKGLSLLKGEIRRLNTKSWFPTYKQTKTVKHSGLNSLVTIGNYQVQKHSIAVSNVNDYVITVLATQIARYSVGDRVQARLVSDETDTVVEGTVSDVTGLTVTVDVVANPFSLSDEIYVITRIALPSLVATAPLLFDSVEHVVAGHYRTLSQINEGTRSTYADRINTTFRHYIYNRTSPFTTIDLLGVAPVDLKLVYKANVEDITYFTDLFMLMTGEIIELMEWLLSAKIIGAMGRNEPTYPAERAKALMNEIIWQNVDVELV